MGGFRVGSVLGFEIRIDYSWFIIFFLILWTFGFVVFPALHPGQPSWVYLAMAAVGTLLFFSSLLAHELSHSVVARRKGIEVSGITLFVFGGMAHTRMEFEEPMDEFLVAGVGPLSSLAIGGMFYVAAGVAGQLGAGSAVVAVAGYLAIINVVLALFNLIPGFPLDGGRLFRAAVWKATGDITRATRWATTGGKIFAMLLIVVGLLNTFAGNIVGGLWLVFIGWFMRNAAESSYVQLVLRQSLDGVRARDAMSPDPVTVPADISLQEFVDAHLFQGRHNAYPVVDRERAVGIVTLDRVKRIPRDNWGTTPVSEAMVPVGEDHFVGPDESMSRVLDLLAEADARRVLVRRDDRLVGIITRSDVVRWLEHVRMKEGL
jgi:Zn-dependent protease/predicted transcriptional regulator